MKLKLLLFALLASLFCGSVLQAQVTTSDIVGRVVGSDGELRHYQPAGHEPGRGEAI